MNTVHKSLTEDAATTMVHAFVTSRVDYCNSILHRASAASVQPLQNVLNAAARIILRKQNSTTSPLTFEINFIGCPFSRELNRPTKCASLCTSVCIRQHQHTSLNCAHRCLNQPIVVTSVQLLRVTLQFHSPEQRDTAKSCFAVSGSTL